MGLIVMLNKLLFRAVEEEEQGPEKKEKKRQKMATLLGSLRRSDSDVPLSSDVVSEPHFASKPGQRDTLKKPTLVANVRNMSDLFWTRSSRP